MSQVAEAPAVSRLLTDDEVRAFVRRSLATLDLAGKRVLLIIPDDTRTCPIGLLVRSIAEALGDSVPALDLMIALGTHRPMTDAQIDRHLGFGPEFPRDRLPRTRIFNHAWDDPAQLATVGVIEPETLRTLSRGRLAERIDVTINKAVLAYDEVIVVGPTFPHEVVGFSGGNKYFFPGVAGREIIDVFHWLGALITNRGIIGTRSTPVREVVDHCAAMIPVSKHCFSLVVSKQGLHGLSFGTPEEAYAEASVLSGEVHIKRFPKPFHTVVSVCPEMYPELWTAGKCMYKLEPVIAPGGRLIIYGPHLAEVSRTHGRWIEEVGYHVLPYFTEQWDRFAHVPRGVLAHSTHVKGRGRYEGGVETPDVEVILATALSSEACAKINLGYADPASVDIDSYRGREDEGILVVDRAGEVLHRLESDAV